MADKTGAGPKPRPKNCPKKAPDTGERLSYHGNPLEFKGQLLHTLASKGRVWEWDEWSGKLFVTIDNREA